MHTWPRPPILAFRSLLSFACYLCLSVVLCVPKLVFVFFLAHKHQYSTRGARISTVLRCMLSLTL